MSSDPRFAFVQRALDETRRALAALSLEHAAVRALTARLDALEHRYAGWATNPPGGLERGAMVNDVLALMLEVRDVESRLGGARG